MIREIFPKADISDRTALALFAWHALVGTGAMPHQAAEAAFEHADRMLDEIVDQEARANAGAGSR